METTIVVLLVASVAAHYYALRLRADLAEGREGLASEQPDYPARRRRAELWCRRSDVFLTVMQIIFLAMSLWHVSQGELRVLSFVGLCMMFAGGRLLTKVDPLPASAMSLSAAAQIRIMMRSIRLRFAFPLVLGGLIMFVAAY